MRLTRPVASVFLVLGAIFALTAVALSESDQAAAERILGPRWKPLSRRAGMVFAGTVLSEPVPIQPTPAARVDRAVPTITLRFRVDRAIAGVEPGQILTIHEWTGAWLLQRPMHQGEHFLLFLYAPSRLGLTSPVGGRQGQVRLDATGRNAADQTAAVRMSMWNATRSGGLAIRRPASGASVTVDQLERAIRSARGE